MPQNIYNKYRDGGNDYQWIGGKNFVERNVSQKFDGRDNYEGNNTQKIDIKDNNGRNYTQKKRRAKWRLKKWIYIKRKYNSLYNYYIIAIHIKYILRILLIIKLNYF